MKTVMKILPVLIVTAFLIGCPGGSVKSSPEKEESSSEKEESSSEKEESSSEKEESSSEKEESSSEKEEAFSTISDAWSVLRGSDTGTSRLWGVILDNPNDWYEGDTAPKADENGYHFIWLYDVFAISIYNVSDGIPIVKTGFPFRKRGTAVESELTSVVINENEGKIQMKILYTDSSSSPFGTSWYHFLQMGKIGDDKVKLRKGTVKRLDDKSDLSDQAVTLQLISSGGGVLGSKNVLKEKLKGVWEVNPKTPGEWLSDDPAPAASGSHYFTWEFVDDEKLEITNVAASGTPIITTGTELPYEFGYLSGFLHLEIKNPNGAVVYDLLLNHLSDDIVILTGNIVKTDDSPLLDEHVILRK